MKKEYLTIEEVKQTELDILNAINQICSDNKIEFYLCGGTMLGAIRHKGFIPWDDDIDIFLERKEYEKLIAIIKEKKEYSWLEILDDTNDNYYYPFAKAVDNRTIAKMDDNKTEHGIWVDIFPIDNLPDNSKKRIKLIKKCYFYRALIISMTTDFNMNKKDNKIFIKKFLNLYTSIVGKNRVYNRYKKIINKSLNYNDSKYVACLCPTYGINEIFEREKLFEKEKYLFEGQYYNGTKNYDMYLKSFYGDYMTLPPENKRYMHEITAWRK